MSQITDEATRHAIELEQCAIFAADVGPSIARAMTDAAAWLRSLAALSTPPVGAETGEVVVRSDAHASGEVKAWWCEHGDGSIEVVMWPDARDKYASLGYAVTPLFASPGEVRTPKTWGEWERAQQESERK